MVKVLSSKELLKQFESMNRENSVQQVFIPGKGRFTIRLEEEDQNSIAADVKANPNIRKMINRSIEEYKQGKFLTTDEAVKSLSVKDFR